MTMTKQEGMKIKTGDEVDIFTDPYTETDLEGIAIVKKIHRVTDESIFMTVHFCEDEEWECDCYRRIDFI